MRFQTIDPFGEFDRMFRMHNRPTLNVDYDVIRHEEQLELLFDLPGFDADAIDLTIDGRDLVLSAERSLVVPEGATLVQAGRRQARITRRLHLGDAIDTGGLEATYDNGVLRVTLPLRAEATPRKIAIGGSNTNVAIEA